MMAEGDGGGMITEALEALVLADAIGALSEQEQRELHAQLAELPADAQDAVARLYDSALLVAASAESHEPPPGARDRILAAARETAQYTLRASDAWTESGLPGITAKVLAVDQSRGLVTMLLRGEAGARYPSHRHSTPEECYVVRGRIRIGDLELAAGDFHHAEFDTDHDEITVLEPAEVLLVGAIADYLPS